MSRRLMNGIPAFTTAWLADTSAAGVILHANQVWLVAGITALNQA